MRNDQGRRSGPGSQLSPHERAASEASAPCPPSRASTRPRNSARVAPILDAEVPMSGTPVVRTRGNQRNPTFRDRRFIFPVRPAMGEIPSHLTAEIRSRASSFPPHDHIVPYASVKVATFGPSFLYLSHRRSTCGVARVWIVCSRPSLGRKYKSTTELIYGAA
jgi:hypothetical protein